MPEVKTFKVTEAEIGVGIRNIVIYPKEKSGLGVIFENKFKLEDIFEFEDVDDDFTPCYHLSDKELVHLLNFMFGFNGTFEVIGNDFILFLQNKEDRILTNETEGLLEMLVNFSYQSKEDTLSLGINLAETLGYNHIVDMGKDALEELKKERT